MSASGLELVEQEKCKLTYAQFFDGVQCFDAATSRLHLATPDLEFNSYDVETKTFSSKQFTVRPVTPVDIDNLISSYIEVDVDIEVTGLEVTQTADEYSKTKIIPIYYLEDCTTSSWGDYLDVCIIPYQNTVVTKVSFTEGSLSFLTNEIIKYVEPTGLTRLFSLQYENGNRIAFEPGIQPANLYHFPLAYYLEEIPVEAERIILNDFLYANEYVTTRSNISACSNVNSTSIFQASNNFDDLTTNDWYFIINFYRSEGTIIDNTYTIDLLFLDYDTGIYTAFIYKYEFFDKNDSPIDLGTAVDQNDPDYLQLRQELGTAICSSYYKLYIDDIFIQDTNNYSFGYPSCENLSVYSLDTCTCEGGANPCWGQTVYSCEECDPDTGEITDICTGDEFCTIFGCKANVITSSCICIGTDYGWQNFPVIKAAHDRGVCAPENYEYYKLTKDGDILAGMGHVDYHDHGEELPELRLANVYDYVTPVKYNYDGRERSISVIAFLLLTFTEATEDNIEALLTYDSWIIKASEVSAMCPGIDSLVLDWFSYQSSTYGSLTTYGYPCGYSKLYITFERDGFINYFYRTISGGVMFIYPGKLGYEAITSSTVVSLLYEAYCEKVKYLGGEVAYTYGLFLNKIPEEGPLEIG